MVGGKRRALVWVGNRGGPLFVAVRVVRDGSSVLVPDDVDARTAAVEGDKGGVKAGVAFHPFFVWDRERLTLVDASTMIFLERKGL